MRSFTIGVFALAVTGVILAAPACGGEDGSTFDGGGASSSGDGGNCGVLGCTGGSYPDGGRPGCTGLGCSQVDCAGGATTTLTGKVFDPAGRVALYNVVVYVPNGDPAPITAGLGETCDRCDGSVSGNPIAITRTDPSGSFTLKDVPAGTDFPIIMQIGKWRRKVTIPKIEKCQTAAATDAQVTRLPKSRDEGDMPRIALTTGSADPLECLLRKIGIADSEFGIGGSESRVHLFAGGSTAPATATASLKAGASFGQAATLWGTTTTLQPYDIVMLSCEGGENPATKPEGARTALYDYAKKGGRVFTSHYHHYWFSNSPVPEVKALATWTNDFTCVGPSCVIEPEPLANVTVQATLNTGFAKGAAMKDWLDKNGALTAPDGTLAIQEARHNVAAVGANALSWMTIKNPAAGDRTAHEYVSFNAPIGATDAEVCGRVVYTDLHVGAGDKTGVPFPDGCDARELTPQQKALEFMFFDLSSCVQRDDQPVK